MSPLYQIDSFPMTATEQEGQVMVTERKQIKANGKGNATAIKATMIVS